MKIAIFSLGPIFNGQVHGGSQKALRDIAVGLGNKGNKIVIYCPKREDNKDEFNLSDNVRVKPIIPLKGSFPAPYEVGPYRLYKSCEILYNELKDYDLLYLHDGQLNIEFLKGIIPTVISLRDFCYTETLLGAINFNQSDIIVNSMHTYQCLLDSFARINSNINKSNVHLIYNGYNYNHFVKKEITNEFYVHTKLPKKGDYKVMGFPHRPDLDKGFVEAIETIHLLKDKNINVKLLIPEYMDKDCSSRANETYNIVNNLINKYDLKDNIIFHNWVSHDLMPEYYSYCDAILCVGNFCEAFSNVSMESLLCETHVVATNTTTYRTMEIRKYLNIADYGDVNQMADICEKIFMNHDNDLSAARKLIKTNYTIEKCVEQYENVFENAIRRFKKSEQKSIDLNNFNNYDERSVYHLAPWCYYLKNDIYDDYLHAIRNDNLDGIFKTNDRLSIRKMIELGVSKERIISAIDDGVILKEWS